METKTIKLSNGGETVVDADDYEHLSQWKWMMSYRGYAYRISNKNRRGIGILMHRIVNNTPENMITDHINRCKLDNRKCNLRTCSPSQNAYNSKIHYDNTSGVKGVHWNKKSKRWRAAIGCCWIGEYKTFQEAVLARMNAEKIKIAF